jgi:methyltransferase-like protein
MNLKKQQLVLNKGKEKYIFRYVSGKEDELLDALIEQVKDKRTNFDWFDAAVLSFRLTQSLISQANELLSENTDVQFHAN